MKAPGTPPGAPVEREWAALQVELAPALAERLLAELDSSCIGAETAPVAGGRERWTLYFEDRAQAEAGARIARGLLAEGADPPRVLGVGDGRWVERYQASLHPFDIGRGFTVDPTGAAEPAGERRILRLVPGQAFGTGEHPTTKLCVAAVEQRVVAGSRWLDIGCGSGILAVVAAHCGAGRVLALDDDPLAVAVARRVVAGNCVADVVRVGQQPHRDLAPEAWDGVVVNISTPFLLAEADALGRLLVAGGTLVASGFPVADTAAVHRALEGGPFERTGVASQAGWGGVVARKRAELR